MAQMPLNFLIEPFAFNLFSNCLLTIYVIFSLMQVRGDIRSLRQVGSQFHCVWAMCPFSMDPLPEDF